MTSNSILSRLKGDFGHPYTSIELTDEEIVRDIINGSALSTFSPFYPRIANITLNDIYNSPENSHDLLGIWFSYDDCGENEIRINHINDGFLRLRAIRSHSVSTDVNFKELEQGKYLISNEQGSSNPFEWLSDYNTELTPSINHLEKGLTFELMLKHEDCSTIPTRLEHKFLELCKHLFVRRVLNIRNQSESIKSGIGDIALNNSIYQQYYDSYQQWYLDNLDNVRTGGSRTKFILG